VKHSVGKSFSLAFLLIAALLLSHAQDEIKKRQQELETLREEIKSIEAEIKDQQKSEKTTLELLDSYDRKATLVRALINRLLNAEKQLQKRIDSIKNEMTLLEAQLQHLKDHYAAYVTSVYKAGNTHDIELLMSSRSMNQALIRAEYLRRFTDQRKEDAEKIAKKKREIEDLEAHLQEDLTEQRRLIAEKGVEEDRLASLILDRQDALRRIRKDKKLLQREIERKIKSAKELESLIASLIEAERMEREKGMTGVQVPRPAAVSVFEARKGKLPWPVNEGAVVAHFGNHTHPTLKTVTHNPGIDISVRPGTPVLAVADGRVARIWWLVSYGNLIIIDHGGGYRTIYAHLADIRVNEGQEVREGEIIATSGETLDGSRLHFEVWKERDKQNPEHWLARR
jgi:septal ring factor EnvC (AmiA/AmiB activator)